MDFKTKLKIYAELLVKHGLNIQPGQLANIAGEACHSELMLEVAEAAYKAGAKYVNCDLIEPRLGKLRLNYSSEEGLQHIPQFLKPKYEELVSTNGANLRIVGEEYPDLYADSDPVKINRMQSTVRSALKFFYDEGIGKSKVHWLVAAAPTKAWAKKIFPEQSEDQAYDSLWDAIFKICRVEEPNCLEAWKVHNQKLHLRALKLTSMKIRKLYFTGPGTELEVALSEKALFKGGGDLSPRGVEYEPNIPTEEVFTTPDARGTFGKVKATRPFYINGRIVRGLALEFKNGAISSSQADEGHEAFAAYIATDDGAKRLGEVALVGIDSPIYQTGRVFQEILFDENAACHIAVGSCYKFCLEDGAVFSDEELAKLGANDSNVHLDMMISSNEVDVEALCYDGSRHKLIRKGAWGSNF
jgi:aminopeptidase